MNIQSKISVLTVVSALAFGAFGADAAETKSIEVNVSVAKFETPGARLMIALFYNKQAYKSDNRLRGRVLDVEANTASVVFSNLPAGEYAIKLFYDVNGNGKLDTNLLGIPSEPFGFSNDAPASFGPAKWDAAKFNLTSQQVRQDIHLVRVSR